MSQERRNARIAADLPQIERFYAIPLAGRGPGDISNSQSLLKIVLFFHFHNIEVYF